MENFSTRDLIVEVVNKLFIYTDERDWNKLQSEVFTVKVLFDMISVGGKRAELDAKEICELWARGFEGIDSVNHLAGNHIVWMDNYTASVFVYATATHFKEAATKGKTREFVGTYNIELTMNEDGWRINRFKYNLKYANGNLELT